MVFRKGGKLPSHLKFYYDGKEKEIVTKFTYLGVTVTPGGSFQHTQSVLAGQAHKAIVKMNKHLFKFIINTIAHLTN